MDIYSELLVMHTAKILCTPEKLSAVQRRN